MIGLLILTHGELAKGYLSAAELISGKAENIDSLGLFHETSIEAFKDAAAEKMQALDQGEGVLVFCDIFGASPYNVTAQNYHLLKGKVNYRSVTGVNLPMVIEAICSRETMELDQLAQYIQTVGKEGIKELFETMGRKEQHE
ncbi:PTS sugar transporter subunit IIA [Candidatus Enterococcus ferrettii]|uniref:PTS system, mannose-specific IIA component n=1 Tax=Candidatus Enterococcus ferrettii TaxID=2815324 RepID=A0ABV0EUL7_9ENTE|nr:PTS sugar transporter subunit IIA [Enterococcus sp. 665A]MBO1339354.1 PTS sugar transporter subunit IIA [Enterococcus sp. 665A]